MDQPGDVDYSQRVEDAIGLISKAVDQCASSMQLDTSPNARRIVELDVPLPFIDSQTNSNNDCKCKPWDYSLFLRRAQTFTTSNWFAKPKEVGPLQCARYGWTNCGPNQLECQICGAQILDEVSSTLKFEGECNASLSLVERFNEAHKDNCPWKNNVSPRAFLKFQIKSDQTVFTDVIIRKQKLRKMLQNFSASSSNSRKRKREICLNVTDISKLSNIPFLSSCSDRLLMLSLFGWNSGSSDIENNEKCGTIKCTLCNREIGIWNTVDPLNSHRYFCPYRVSNRMPDGVSSKRGFEIVAEAYLRYKKKYSHNNKISDDTTNGEVNNTHVDESISESADINPADALRAVKKAFLSTKSPLKRT